MVTKVDERTGRKHLDKAIKRNKLEKFYADKETELATLARQAPQILEDWAQKLLGVLGDETHTAAEVSEYQLSMLELALYEIHVLLDNSGSMELEDRMETAYSVVENIVKFDSMIQKQGVHVHLLNGDDIPGQFSDDAQLKLKWADITIGGGTKLGTVTKSKIWSPILQDLAKFTKPCLVYIITDGEPTGEPEDAFKNSLLGCKNALQDKGYSAESIAFSIIQVGTDQEARAFLEKLRVDQDLISHIDVQNDDNAVENAFRKGNGRSEGEQHIMILESLIGAINTSVRD